MAKLQYHIRQYRAKKYMYPLLHLSLYLTCWHWCKLYINIFHFLYFHKIKKFLLGKIPSICIWIIIYHKFCIIKSNSRKKKKKNTTICKYLSYLDTPSKAYTITRTHHHAHTQPICNHHHTHNIYMNKNNYCYKDKCNKHCQYLNTFILYVLHLFSIWFCNNFLKSKISVKTSLLHNAMFFSKWIFFSANCTL